MSDGRVRPPQASERVIHNPISGERIVIRTSAAKTDGQLRRNTYRVKWSRLLRPEGVRRLECDGAAAGQITPKQADSGCPYQAAATSIAPPGRYRPA